jgi:hypothetical protein
MKKALPPLLFCVTVAFMIFLWFHKPVIVQPAATTVSKEQTKALNDAAIQSNNNTILQLQQRLEMVDAERTAEEQQIGEIKKHYDESSILPDKWHEKGLFDKAANLDVSKQSLDGETNALKGQIEVYKKYNEELLQQQNEKKEGAKKVESYMPIAVTVFLGFVALGLLIWRHGDPHAEKWVYSTFGAILGYWLKGGA